MKINKITCQNNCAKIEIIEEEYFSDMNLTEGATFPLALHYALIG